MNLYQLQHIQIIVQEHLRKLQNEFQPIKHFPDSSPYFVTTNAIRRTEEALRAVNKAIDEYRQKEAR
ncbi:hypothetical protein [Ammoniphilus sp. YIM 78166]|uniref:hypothetical protein n=1 Tax=Ammoniphilus sp. YIM 78166 TaxID=1644106 RepID=UPI00106F6305|nr:hypothetical protein [Ammoniphilus sp. YIM 78166]